MNYIIILILGIIFLLINYLIIFNDTKFSINKFTRYNNNNNNIYKYENFNSINYDNELDYQYLENDVKQELSKMYNIKNSEKLKKHNKNSEKYELTSSSI